MSQAAQDTRPTPTRGVPVMLDKERRLRYTLKTVREIQDDLGEDALSSGVSGSKLAKLLWYGLKWEDPALTPEQVEESIDLQELPAVMKAFTQAVGGKAMVEIAEEVKGPLAPPDAAPPPSA